MTRMRGESVRMLGAAVLGGLVTGLVLVGIAAILGIRSEAAGAGTADAGHVRAIYRAASPSVVLIDAGDRTGSGFLVDAHGHVVTNAHVVGDRTSVNVDLGGRRVEATVRGVEPSVDVAVLTLEESQGDVPALPFGDSSTVRIGDPVVAIGSPFGLNGSLSSGIVSGLRRQIDSPNGFAIQGVIQTDAALNPGNSGGPLLSMDGRVVGMATQIATESGTNEGIGFAVPSTVVQGTAGRIIATGRADLPYMGIVGGDVPEGVLLQSVVAGGPASGLLRPGDVITEVDGTPADTNAGLAAALVGHAPGDRVTVRILRDGDEMDVPVTLGTRPPAGPTPAP
ncbi:MAG: S1C family serine protease [Thermoleophilia bacterium]